MKNKQTRLKKQGMALQKILELIRTNKPIVDFAKIFRDGILHIF